MCGKKAVCVCVCVGNRPNNKLKQMARAVLFWVQIDIFTVWFSKWKNSINSIYSTQRRFSTHSKVSCVRCFLNYGSLYTSTCYVYDLNCNLQRNSMCSSVHNIQIMNTDFPRMNFMISAKNVVLFADICIFSCACHCSCLCYLLMKILSFRFNLISSELQLVFFSF